MEIDWSTAEVKPPRPSGLQGEGDGFVLEVMLHGRNDKAFDQAWKRETGKLASALGDERRRITTHMYGSDVIGIAVTPINPDDADGERRALEDLVERVNRAAEPARAKYDEEGRRRREEDAAREKQAESLTERFRSQE